MNTFLYEVTQQLIAERGIEGLASTTIVVPSRRAVLHIKDCFKDYLKAHNLQGPIRLPQLTTLSQLFDELSPLYKMDEIQLVCTLYDVYVEVEKNANPDKDQLPLEVFYGWGRQLVQDFSNIDKTYPLVTPDRFLQNAASANILSQLDIDDDVRERLEQLVSNNPSVAASGSKRKEFEIIWNNLPDIYNRFRAKLGAYGYEGARMRSVIECWSDDSIQSSIADKYFVFAGFNYLVPAEKQLMKNLKESGQAAFFWDYPRSGSFTANTKAFKWIQRNAELFGDAAPKRDWDTKDVELVATISSHAQAQFVYQWLMANHHTGDRSAIVICDESVLEQVVYALPQDNEEEPNPRFKYINITKGFPLRQTEIYSRLMNWLEEGNTVEEFMNAVVVTVKNNEELQSLSFTELLSMESTFQLLSHLTRFSLMKKSGKMPANISQRALITLLRRYLGGVSFPFHGEPLANVQVTGVLETRAMDFDNLLLLNVEEGIVPNVSPDHSYLPYYLRKYYGLQTHEESTDVYAYNFFRLLSRAKKITMTFAGSETGTNRKTMSRFVKQIMASNNFRVTKHLLLEPNKVLPILALSNATLLNESSNATKSYISPSEINTFRQCEMRYFWRYKKGIHEPKVEDVLISHADLGTIVHSCIQEIYTRYGNVNTIPQPIDWSAIRSLETVATNHPIEYTTIKTYISRIIEADKQLAKQGLEIVGMEKEAYCTIDVPEYGNIRIGGRIDRIDKLNGQLRIVDYKTGKLKDDNIYQINIYREALHASSAALYLCQNKPDELVYDVPVPDEEAFVSELAQTVHDMLSLTDPKMTEKESTCRYCPYKILCGKKVEE